MCDTIECCAPRFVDNLLADVGVCRLFRRFTIEAKLVTVINTYNENAPKNSLSSIADDFYNCVEPQVGQSATITATELGKVIVFLIILTIIFVLLLVIILGLLDKTNQSEIVILIVLFFTLIYVTVGWLLIHNTSIIISDEITKIDNTVNDCFHNAITEFQIFENQQDAAINTALCSYSTNTATCL